MAAYTAADDVVLIQRHQTGDRKALGDLFRRHYDRAFRHAMKLSRDASLAGDVVSEAFVRVQRSIGGFEGKCAFSTWLYRIITNCYLDIRKKERSRQSISLDAPLPSEEGTVELQVEDDSPSPQDHAESLERLRMVQEAVDTLPHYQREMILMYHVHMLSYEEIADTLDVPIGTVKSRLNRARISLRDMLDDHGDLFTIAA